MVDENFYIQLKKFFKAQGITQQQIADKIGTSQAYINQLITGKSLFGKQMANRFQCLYGLSAAWLLTGEGEMLASSHGSVGQGTATDTTTVDKLIDVVTRQQEQMSHQQEQIDQLLKLIKDKL